MMSRGWAEDNGATVPVRQGTQAENFATRQANGTGPFRVVARNPDVRSTFAVHERWWDRRLHNVDRVTMTPIAADATRMAALLAGQVDMAFPVPPQDVARIGAGPATGVVVGPEIRTIFLGLDQFRDELLYTDVKGKNPFKDRRVRLAFYQAIDIDAIRTRVMRDQSIPSAMMIGPGVAGFDPSIARYPFDPEAARRLLAEAGYANGFRVTLDCPNDRYVNDEQICQALVP
ncbi:MAG: ABC transporter substrate-binding protein, partial [Alphaproteobacteria bacterium]|nr:ABC transporter substrate-binding protein [Alphaproteobacteria bacterium]